MGSLVSRSSTLAVIGAVILGAAVSLPVRHLIEPDEARYAEVAREMVESGNWLVPHLNGVPYTHKPPLFMWMIAALRSLGLPWTAAAVAPAWLAFVATLAIVPALGRALALSRDEGRTAATVLASTPFFAAFGLVARMDMVLVATHTAAALALARMRAPDAGPTSYRRWHLAFWLLVGLGILVKGPVALVLGVVTGAAWGFLDRPSRLLRVVFVGWGPLLCLTVVLAWLVPAALSMGTDYVDELVVRQSVGRLAASFAHRQPFVYHLATYPFTGLPWTPLVFFGLYRALRHRRDRSAVLLAAAVVTTLLFFSLVSGKIVIYLLPLFPVASLLAARSLARQEMPTHWLASIGGAGLALLGLAVTVAPMVRTEFVVGTGYVRFMGACVAGAGALVIVRALSARPAWHLLAYGGLLFPAAVVPALMISADRGMTLYETGELVRRLEPEAAEVLTVDLSLFGVPLYTGRRPQPLLTAEQVRASLAAGRVVLVRRSSWQSMRDLIGHLSIAEIHPRFTREPLVVVRRRADRVDAGGGP